MTDVILSSFLSLFALFGKEEQVDEAAAAKTTNLMRDRVLTCKSNSNQQDKGSGHHHQKKRAGREEQKPPPREASGIVSPPQGTHPDCRGRNRMKAHRPEGDLNSNALPKH